MMFCPKCGEAIADDSAFCPKCGEKIKTTDNEPAVVYASQKEAAPAVSEKSKSQGLNIFLIWGILPILSLIFLKLSYYGTGFASSLLGDKVLYTTGYEMLTFDFEMFSYDIVMGFVSIINAFLIVLCVVNIVTAIMGYIGKATKKFKTVMLVESILYIVITLLTLLLLKVTYAYLYDMDMVLTIGIGLWLNIVVAIASLFIYFAVFVPYFAKKD